MRDAAALIILQMNKATGISKLSQARAQQLSGSPGDVNLQITASEDAPK